MTQQLKKILLLLGDISVLYVSLYLTLLLRYHYLEPGRWAQHFPSFTFIYFLWVIIFYIAGLYDLNLARNNAKFFNLLFRTLLICGSLAVTFFYFMPYLGITPKTNLFLDLILFAFLFTAWRRLFNSFIKFSPLLNNILIIGESKEMDQLIERINDNPQLGYKIIETLEPQALKNFSYLKDIIKKNNITSIVLGNSFYHDDDTLAQALYQYLPLKISFIDLTIFYEEITNKIPISLIKEVWFLENIMEGKKNVYEAIKKIFDFLSSLILGIISLILYPAIALAIRLDSKGPIFFQQIRIGKDGKPFKAIKFRSMFISAENSGPQWAKIDDPRTTKVGGFLRKTRLDELPQFWNIIRGEMSFIGPRPERPEFVQELEQKIPYYQIRHLIKPGLTGWAQINFPYGASVEDALEKLQYELYYLKNRSLSLDLSIFLKTIKIIVKQEGR